MHEPAHSNRHPMSPPLFMSSGDLLADRRYAWALDYLAQDDLPAAADLLTQAVALAPHFASAWFALGDLRERTSDHAGAIDAFRSALAADTEDRHGAGLRLARLGVGTPGAAMSVAYVRAVFDQYAPRFDQALVEGLSYRG